MRVFDLEAAKAGAPVCTDLSEPVRILCFDRKSSQFPIIALIDKGDNSESFVTFTKEGKESYSIGATTLMMRDDNYAEKLARGEYAPSVRKNRTVENPTCKESLPVDREYWRRVYAGQIMSVVLHAAITTGVKVKDKYKDMPTDVAAARSAIILADVLIEELEKTEK